MTFSRASIDQIVDLRWRILRAGLDRSYADFPGDDLPGTIHLAAIETAIEATESRDRVVGCASFMQTQWEDFPAWQLRGMAVDDGMRGKGVGTNLLRFAEQFCVDAGYSRRFWCNARVPAIQFYERAGWKTVGDEFVVETAGPHRKMIKFY